MKSHFTRFRIIIKNIRMMNLVGVNSSSRSSVLAGPRVVSKEVKPHPLVVASLGLLLGLSMGVPYEQAEAKFEHEKNEKNIDKKNQMFDGEEDTSIRTKSGNTEFEGTTYSNIRYERELGRGGFGVVYLATNTATGDKIAAKVMKKHILEDGREHALVRGEYLSELNILTELGVHENIGGLIGYFENATENVMLFELILGGELFDRIVEQGRLSECEVKLILRQVAKGIAYIHSRGIVHADIKPENIMLSTKSIDGGSVKIVDFGSAAVLRQRENSDQSNANSKLLFQKPRGTAAYRAPEMVLHQPCDEKIDIWGFGVVMYILLTGMHPFDPDGSAHDAKILLRAVEHDKLEEYLCASKYYTLLPPAAKQLITQCLSSDPAQRPSADEALGHPYLSNTPLSTSSIQTQKMVPIKVIDRLKSRENREMMKLSLITAGMLLPTQVDKVRSFYERETGIRPAPPDQRGQYDVATKNTRLFKDAFDLFDSGHKGYIMASDLKHLFETLGQHISQPQIDLLMRETDLDNDTQISLEEFIGMLKRRIEHNNGPQDITAMFKVFDSDNNGYIDASEVQYILNNLGANYSLQDIQEMMNDMGLVEEGRISYEEFERIVKQLGKVLK